MIHMIGKMKPMRPSTQWPLADAENRDAAICWPLGSAPSHLLRRHHTGGTRHPPVGATPHCIDFILTVGDIKAEATEVLLQAGKRCVVAWDTSPITSDCLPG